MRGLSLVSVFLLLIIVGCVQRIENKLDEDAVNIVKWKMKLRNGDVDGDCYLDAFITYRDGSGKRWFQKIIRNGDNELSIEGKRALQDRRERPRCGGQMRGKYGQSTLRIKEYKARILNADVDMDDQLESAIFFFGTYGENTYQEIHWREGYGFWLGEARLPEYLSGN